MTSKIDPSSVKALVFDVFGTVVDWRGSIVAEGERDWAPRGLKLDWAQFADDWRAGYGPAMNPVRTRELPWTNLDALHRMLLDALLPKRGIDNLSEADKQHLNRIWHRLNGWPDSSPGLAMLKQRFIISTLSNGNVALLTNMAKHAGLPWDCILGAEIFKHYKPDPEVYLGAAEILGLQPSEVMMVAAHERDLQSAAKLGLRTGFVYRPHERGPEKQLDMPDTSAFDVVANDLVEMAKTLGAG